ncbi:MAG: NAD-dependent epimerase/dehydratase family protein [Gemmatimonadaceae bacterium]
MPTALVTGATGLVGSHVVERLARDGWRVRALVRDPRAAARLDWLAAAGVELRAGDVLDRASFAAAAAGADVVFHTAAAITPRGGWEAYRRPNVDGTANAIAAAAAAGARLLHLSSVAVYGPEARYGAARTDESTPLAPLPDGAHYARSKRESEALVLAAHGAGRVWATAIRPSVIYGRRDRQFVPRAARLLRTGLAPIVGAGASTLAVVHAANVADAAVLAATTDAAGGRAYNAANDFDVTVADFVRLAADGLGRRVRRVPVPEPLARAGIVVVKHAAALLRGGSVGIMASSTFDFVTRDNPFSSERAKRELGWRPEVRPEVGVPDAFRWWKARGAPVARH